MEEVEEEYDERETICAAQKEGILVKDLVHVDRTYVCASVRRPFR